MVHDSKILAVQCGRNESPIFLRKVIVDIIGTKRSAIREQIKSNKQSLYTKYKIQITLNRCANYPDSPEANYTNIKTKCNQRSPVAHPSNATNEQKGAVLHFSFPISNHKLFSNL